MDTDRKKKKRTPKKSLDRGSTSSRGNKELGTRSAEKQRGMEFGFRKTATAVMKPDILEKESVEMGFSTMLACKSI